jgi:hypothetical protein
MLDSAGACHILILIALAVTLKNTWECLMRAFLRCNLLMIALCALGLAQPAQSASVLVLSSGNTAEDATIEYAIESFGHAVDLGPQYINFNGTTSLAGYESLEHASLRHAGGRTDAAA